MLGWEEGYLYRNSPQSREELRKGRGSCQLAVSLGSRYYHHFVWLLRFQESSILLAMLCYGAWNLREDNADYFLEAFLP